MERSGLNMCDLFVLDGLVGRDSFANCAGGANHSRRKKNMHHVQPFVRKSKQDRDLDESQKKEIATVFSYYDSDAKGYLTKLEYEMAFVVLFGYKPCKVGDRQL